jgi:uncharacterized protein (TIRG00374 family)
MRIPKAASLTAKYLVGVGIAGVFLYLTFRKVSFGDVLSAARGANYWWMAAALLLPVGANIFRAWRWNVLLSPVKDRLPLWYAFTASLIGYMINNVLPRGGEVARTFNQARLAQIPVSSVLASVIVERVLDIVMLLLLLAGSSIFLSAQLGEAFPAMQRVSIILVVATGVALVLFWALSRRPDASVAFLRERLRRLSPRLAETISNQLLKFFHGLAVVQYPSKYAALAVSSVLVWACYVGGVFLAFVSFGLFQHEGLGYLSATAITAVGGVGMTVPVPGGAGTYHYFVSRSLEIMFGVGPAKATAFATVLWTGMILTLSAGGALSLLAQRILLRSGRGPAAPGEPGAASHTAPSDTACTSGRTAEHPCQAASRD